MSTLDTINVDGIFNIRDLGGHPTDNGGKTQGGLILRADGLNRADESGRQSLVDHGLGTVIDLRTGDELNGDGQFDHPDVRFHHIPIIDSLETVTGEADEIDNILLVRYQDWLADSQSSFAAAFEAIANSVDENRTVAFHCTAGKDRTGVLSALILGSVGVGDDAVIADYARSEGVGQSLREWYSNRVNSEVMERMRQAMSANMQVAMMGAEPATMAALLTHLRDEWGGARRYVSSIGAEASMDRIAAAMTSGS